MTRMGRICGRRRGSHDGVLDHFVLLRLWELVRKGAGLLRSGRCFSSEGQLHRSRWVCRVLYSSDLARRNG